MTHYVKAAKASVMDLTGTGEEWLFDSKDELIARFWNGMLITTSSLSTAGRSAKDQADCPTVIISHERTEHEFAEAA
jgi:hypothetical protein